MCKFQIEKANAKLKLLSKFRVLILLLYPTVFLGQSLLPGSNVLLASSRNSDILGTVRQSQILSAMDWPWSANLMDNAPNGIPYWSLSAMVQGFNWVAIWLLNLVLPPIQAVTWWVWIGWVFSGLSVYWLAKKIGANEFGAVSAAIFFEMLPWVREKASTHIAYVFICIPVIAVLLLFRYEEKSTKLRLFSLLLFVVTVGFFDLYWFYFSCTVIVLYAILRFKKIVKVFIESKRAFKVVVLGISITLFTGCAIVFLTLKSRLVATGSSSLLNVWNLDFIDQFQSPLWFFIRPTSYHLLSPLPNPDVVSVEDIVHYTGLLIAVLASVVFIHEVKTRSLWVDHRRVFLWVCALFFALLTLPSQVNVFGVDISTPVSFYRYLTPGIRVYSRGGLITEALICVMAGFSISWIAGSGQRNTRRKLAATAIVLLVVIDLNPFGGRNLNSDFANYSRIRNVLAPVNPSNLYILQPETDPWYFPPHITDARIIDDPRDRNWDMGIWNAASDGECSFASWLNERGATHILVPKDDDQRGRYSRKWGIYPSVSLDFEESSCFEYQESSDDGEDGFLYRITSIGQNTFMAENQFPVLEWSGVRELFFRTNYDKGVLFEDGRSLSWVIDGEEPKIRIKSESNLVSRYVVNLSLAAAYGENAQPQVIGLKYGEKTEIVRLEAGPPRTFSIELLGSEQITLKNFLPCTVPSTRDPNNSDTRRLCYAITDVRVKTVVP
jgi:hypothetical protein